MENLKQLIVHVSQKYNINKIILFGSRARGDFSERSDIDLAIYGTLSPAEQALFCDEIENLPYLLKFDIIFVDENTDKQLLQNINKEGIILMSNLETKINNFKNALARLEDAVCELKKSDNSIIRDAVIQRFEFSVELAWKATREYLIDQGFTELNSPKSVMKEAFSYGLIDNNDKWIRILEDRNLTSHIYSESVSIEIANRIANSHIEELKKLLCKIS